MTRNVVELARSAAKKRTRMRYLEFGRDSSHDLLQPVRVRSAEGVTIVDYLKPLVPVPPLNSNIRWAYSTLMFIKSVEFYGAMLFTNLLQVLTHCSSMKELTFTHISLDEYRRFSVERSSYPQSSYQAQNLTTLEFNGRGKLSKDELLLIDFFNRHVDLPALENLSFNMMTYGYHPHNYANEVMERFGETVPTDVVAHLMIKCANHLSNLTIRRHKFVLAEYDAEDPESVAHRFVLLNLTKLRFQYDTIGINYFLRCQHHLEKLECYASYEESSLLAPTDFLNLMAAVGECIKNSEATLKHVHMVGIVAFPQPDEGIVPMNQNLDYSVAPLVNLHLSAIEGLLGNEDGLKRVMDFKIFENCNSLTGLWLTKMNCSLHESPHIFLSNFTFRNSKFLPTGLVQLEIITGHVLPEELTELAERFHQLTNLHYCRVNSLKPYVITEECFTHIVRIQNSWMQILLFNGVLASDFYPQQVLMSHRRPESRRHWEIKISESLCEFVCKETRNRF